MEKLQMLKASLVPPKNGSLVLTLGILVGAPILAMFLLLAVYSVNAPFWDQWIYADLLNKVHDRTLTFHDVWQQHNEHRIFFPAVIQLIVASITHWNVRVEVFMNFFAVLGSYGLMLWLAWKTFKKRWLFVASAAVTAWLLFSPLAYINWIWGFQFAWFFSVLCLVACIWALHKSNLSRNFDTLFWVAAIAAIMCTYSMGNGLLVWVAGLIMLAIYKAGKNKLLAWGGLGAVTIALYFYGFIFASNNSLSVFLHRPFEVLQYVLMYLGHNLGPDSGSATMAGIILVALGIGSLAVAVRQKQLLIRIAPWLALASYGFLTAALAASSRLSTFGVQHSMSFSYATISVLFVIGILAMTLLVFEASLSKILRWPAQWILVAGCLCGLLAYPLATGYVENYLIGVQKMHEQSAHLKKVRACLHSATSASDDCLLTAFPHKEEAWAKLQIIKQKVHWSNF